LKKIEILFDSPSLPFASQTKRTVAHVFPSWSWTLTGFAVRGRTARLPIARIIDYPSQVRSRVRPLCVLYGKAQIHKSKQAQRGGWPVDYPLLDCGPQKLFLERNNLSILEHTVPIIFPGGLACLPLNPKQQPANRSSQQCGGRSAFGHPRRASDIPRCGLNAFFRHYRWLFLHRGRGHSPGVSKKPQLRP